MKCRFCVLANKENVMTYDTESSAIDNETCGMELLALYRITKLIGNAANELDTTLSTIFTVLQETLNMERATLFLYDTLHGKLNIVASCGLTEEEIRRGVYLPGEGICGRIFQSGAACVIPDVHSEPLFLNRTGSRSTIEKARISFLGVPVIVEGKPEGVLSVDRLFGNEIEAEEDIRFLSVLATLIAQFLTLHREIRKKEAKLMKENNLLKSRLHSKHGGHFIIGHSKPMQEVFSVIDKIAKSRVTALILGESGTGKELVARAIHEGSSHPERPFIKVNCAALPETLLESELFGHEKGAFTGAHAARPGRFELADGGTIFLDEIGEMPLSVQAKMLRVLQEKQFERIGGTRTYTVDARIVAATNVSLEEAVQHGSFRADLFYRLNVVPINLPPLREMQNLVERMVILAESDRLTLDDLPHGFAAGIGYKKAVSAAPPMNVPQKPEQVPNSTQKSLEEIEREEIEAALRRNGWVQVRAAKELGLTERQIGYRIKKYGLNRYDSFR